MQLTNANFCKRTVNRRLGAIVNLTGTIYKIIFRRDVVTVNTRVEL